MVKYLKIAAVCISSLVPVGTTFATPIDAHRGTAPAGAVLTLSGMATSGIVAVRRGPGCPPYPLPCI